MAHLFRGRAGTGLPTTPDTVYVGLGGRGNAPMRNLTQFPLATKNKKGVKVAREGYRSIKIKDAEFQHQSLERLVTLLFDIQPTEAK